MADKEWYTAKDIAEMTGVDIKRVWAAIAPLRRAGAITTTIDPNDERVTLVHANSLEAVKRALRVDGGTQTA